MGSEIYSSDIDKIILNEREKPLRSFSELSLSELSRAESIFCLHPIWGRIWGVDKKFEWENVRVEWSNNLPSLKLYKTKYFRLCLSE